MRTLNKYIYKIELYLLKIIPMLLALCSFLNTILFYFGINLTILTYLGGISFLTIGFLYISSYAFQFCSYHRMFLHYILIVNIISYIDMEFNIPISDFNLLILYSVIAFISMIIILIKFKNEKHNSKVDKQDIKGNCR
jgi:hypothetical protein